MGPGGLSGGGKGPPFSLLRQGDAFHRLILRRPREGLLVQKCVQQELATLATSGIGCVVVNRQITERRCWTRIQLALETMKEQALQTISFCPRSSYQPRETSQIQSITETY